MQPSTGFGFMGPSSGTFLYIMSKCSYIKYMNNKLITHKLVVCKT
jgi:hypothetical protein